MSRSAVIVGRVGQVRSQAAAARGRGATTTQLPATVPDEGSGDSGGFMETAKKWVDPGTTSAASTFGGAALGALLAPRLKTNPYVGAAAGAAVGNLASTLVTRAQGGIEGSEIGALALTTAAYAAAGAGIAYASKKTKPINGALLGMGIPVVLFAAYRAFAPQG